MKFFKHLPNFITILNLLTGSVGIILAMQGNLMFAASCIFIAAVFDFMDGFAARILKANSSIGKELDSLADVISFGLLPGIISYSLLSQNSQSDILPWLGLIIPAFSALRLAKFNVDTRQSDQFIGLPTPANAILFASFPMILATDNWQFLGNPTVFAVIVVVFSLLLVAELPLMALKFKNFSWKENKLKYLFLLIALVLLFVLAWMAIPLIILLYIFFSLAGNYL